VARVAELANLQLTSDERERMLHELNSILDYVGILNQIDTTHVEPVLGMSPSATDKLREDVVSGVRPSLSHEAALKNAPCTDGTFFKVPKVIER
jgi:aspartyl-tRNA(Asn)/glutamyl-tRNA(Gln) amidotransferase subunit C